MFFSIFSLIYLNHEYDIRRIKVIEYFSFNHITIKRMFISAFNTIGMKNPEVFEEAEFDIQDV